MRKLIIFLAFFPVFVSAEPLTDLQVKKEIAWQVINLIDYGQTRDISRKCHNTSYYEQNPMLGECPQIQTVEKYFLISAVGHYAITQYLTTHRDMWQNVTIIFSASIVQHNFALGLNINF